MHVFTLIALLINVPVNSYGATGNLFTLDTSHVVKAWDVVINEIMADPDPAAGTINYPEYVELYNKKDFQVSLKNWKFCVGTACKTLPDVFIPADSFIVLTATTGTKNFPTEVNVLGISSFPALTNTGQTLQLQNETGNTIAVVSYTDNWYRDDAKQTGGYSLEQMDAANPCAESQNWKASINGNGGTPGKINSVKASNPDTKTPEISSINVLSPEHIEINFTEAMDSLTLTDPASYEISDIGEPSAISLTKPYYKSATVHLGTSLKNTMVYTLTVKGKIADCVGNVIQKNNSIRFAIPAIPSENDIVINEVLFDPKEGGVDFVEIYNCSQKVVDLKSLFICHYDTITHALSEIKKITGSGYLFFPGEYLVLTENAEKVKDQYRTDNPRAFLNIESLPALNTDAGSICLKTAAAIIDHFTYNSTMHFALLKETKGISLERVNFRRPSNDVTNWHSASSSSGFASPGYKNSQFLEEVITKDPLSVYPETFTPDGDGWNDQVSVYYRFDKPEWSVTILIYDSSGRMVRTLVNNELTGAEGVYSWDGINDNREKERTGIYVIYLEAFNLSGMIKQYKKVCVLSGKN